MGVPSASVKEPVMEILPGYTMPGPTPQDHEHLFAIVRLLLKAEQVLRSWDERDRRRSIRFTTGSLTAMGASIAAAEAADLLPDGVDIDAVVPLQDDPRELLDAAATLLGCLSPGAMYWGGTHVLPDVTELRDELLR
jgi:hypothetical protein